MDVTCSAVPCPVILSATCVFYQGANLVYTGINNNDNLEIALQKIDAKFQDAGLGYIFQNGIIQLGPGLPVGLGGSLTQDTLITGAHKLSFSGELEASKLITTGGTSSQFVKGDGSLDSTAYQPTGNYISSLSGDGVANGPGSAIFTLANTGVIANTYGSATRVPIITVDAKGRVTNLTSTLIAVPSSLLLFGGDVTGSGNTGSSVTLTLLTVNPNPQPSNTFLKFAVNGKGLVTSTAPITNLDIESVLGYIPVPNTRTITINGLTQDLSSNRSWTINAALPPQTGNAGKYLFTDGFVASWQVVSSGGVANVTASLPISSTGGLTPNISISQATTSTDGYLSSTNWNTFNNKQNTITLTTTGSGAATFIADVLNIPTQSSPTFTSLTVIGDSGASTLISGVLNVPTYSLSGLGGQPLATNLTSLSGLTYASTSFVKMTAAGTFALDTNTYLTSAVTSIATAGLISGGTITGTGTITTSMATNKLVGRSTSGLGVMEEISVGTGLSLSGGTLNVTAQVPGFEQHFLLMGA
jgi:hypothetical protein